MSSRFVSAGTSQDADNAEGAAEKVTDAMKAAKLKLFGSLTHEKVEWHPAKLLCIRFNVKHPYGDHSVVGVPTSHKSKFDIFGRLEVCRNSPRLRQSDELKMKAFFRNILPLLLPFNVPHTISRQLGVRDNISIAVKLKSHQFGATKKVLKLKVLKVFKNRV